MIRPRHIVALVVSAGSSFVHAAPPEGSHWTPIPELSDEFNGPTLDAAKWHDHNPTWLGRPPGWFAKSNVTVSGGKLHLRAMAEDAPNAPEGYHAFTTAAVQSRAMVRHGYFEIKCRPMKSKASSAFWFYRAADTEWTEIDVFEICGAGKEWEGKYHTNAHVFRSPTVRQHQQNPGVWQAAFDFTAEDHVYALEWDDKLIRWYVDGKVVRELENKHWHQELTLNFDSETMPEWFGLPDKATLPAIFSIDYVRAWKKAP
jgi:beta-glucanase (GH16 family)